MCRTTNLKFTELTARDIRPTKDVTGKLPKSPEAATLERARNHLVRANEKGFQTIEDRYNRDPVFAANMMENGQTVSNIRIWECLTCAVIPATQRSAAQRALNLGASQVPMGETAEDYPARTVFFYGIRGETLKAANLISNVSDPNVCVGFGGTFFNLKNFAEPTALSPAADHLDLDHVPGPLEDPAGGQYRELQAVPHGVVPCQRRADGRSL